MNAQAAPADNPQPARRWWQYARCLGMPTDIFYRAPAETAESWELRQQVAKTICRRCPVRQDCWLAAVREREPEGIWGGVEFPDEARRARRLEAKARAIVAGRAAPFVPAVCDEDDGWC